MIDGLFDLNDFLSEHPSAISDRTKGNVWTEKKAHFIARYLKSFTYVTKHGTYLDAFAGPQEGPIHSNWTAKQVLENEPKWLRRIHLFESDKEQVAFLKHLAGEHHQEGDLKKLRKVAVHEGERSLITNLVDVR